jgi:hypothetical protein
MPKELTFTELLSEKDYIKKVAHKLGFSLNVRIARYGNAGNSGQFSLIVKYDEKTSPDLIKGSIDPDSALKIWLTYKYESKFFILPTSVAKDAALKDIVKSSVNIDDEDAIARLFGHKVEQMTVLNDYVEDEGVLKSCNCYRHSCDR